MATAQDKAIKFKRDCRQFIDYINYDWDSDQNWATFKTDNMKDINSPKQIEEIKREYFKMNVNQRLDTAFFLDTEEEKQEFLDYCKYIGTILSLSQIFKTQTAFTRNLCHFKHLLYFTYIVCFPLRAKYPIVLLNLLAFICSLVQRKASNKSKDSFLHIILADEESMHLMWFLTYILLNYQMAFIVDSMFLLWAFLNTCEWFDFISMKHPGVPIVPLFSNLVEMTADNQVSIVMIKNYMEVTIVMMSFVVWYWSWCAPIIGIILVQAMRIKFLGSNFTKTVLRSMDGKLQASMPAVVYSWTAGPIKNWCSNLAGIKESLENEVKDGQL